VLAQMRAQLAELEAARARADLAEADELKTRAKLDDELLQVLRRALRSTPCNLHPTLSSYLLHPTLCTLHPEPTDDVEEQVGRLQEQVEALQQRRQGASDMEKLQFLVQDLGALLASEEAARSRAGGRKGPDEADWAAEASDATTLRRALSAVQDEVAVLRAEQAQAPSLRTQVPQKNLVNTKKSPTTQPRTKERY
jgi:hypothetical protein